MKKIRCSSCGKAVSDAEIPDGAIIRAFIECPDCIEKQTDWEEELKRIDEILPRRTDPIISRLQKIGNLIEIAKQSDNANLAVKAMEKIAKTDCCTDIPYIVKQWMAESSLETKKTT